MTTVDPALAGEVLDLPMTTADGNTTTVRDYLITLLATLWRERAEFDGKRPFGFSDWEYDLYRPLAVAGLIAFETDDDALQTVDETAGHRMIAAAIQRLGTAPGEVTAR